MKAFVVFNVHGERADVIYYQAWAFNRHKLNKSMIYLPHDDNFVDLHIEKNNYITCE